MKVIEYTILVTTLFSLLVWSVVGEEEKPQGVTYDSRSLIINGARELVFSGSIHYPRSTPEMWPDLIRKAKEGGLNAIATYVFWNIHEPLQGQFNFEGPYDIVKFVKLVWEHGLFVILRHGPFIQAEWNHGGLPYWLREVPNIYFRTDNEPFKQHMQRFVTMVHEKMKAEKLYASQGGPIILSQIENEYNTIQRAYEGGRNYIRWAASMALALNTGVPWVMCKQKDAPGPVINACNGRHCGDTFPGPNRPDKPSIWTENWTAQFRVFGDPPSQRSAEDIAFSVTRWFSKNGSLTNYYMYHGGTNFARTAASFMTTRYYDEAPLDEFGLERGPKWGHLRDLHRALNLCKKALLWGSPYAQKLGEGLEARFYEQSGTNECVAFLANNHSKTAMTVNFRNNQYYLPPHSISILPDCQTVVFNSQQIVAQHNSRNLVSSSHINKNLKWEMYSENVPIDLPLKNKIPLELYNLTKDTTDYAWYTTSIHLTKAELPMKKTIKPVLRVANQGHAMLAFVNGEFIGSAHGSQIEMSFVLQKPVELKAGINYITFLNSLVGLPDSGAYMERRFTGPKGVSILGLNAGTLDLTRNIWGHQVSLNGLATQLYTEEGSKKVKWVSAEKGGPPVTWFKTYFDAPGGKSPVAIWMNNMVKGMIWVNGKSIGRYWMSYVSPLGAPTQSEYHIPRSYLKPKDNLLVILEEEIANPEKIEILTVNRDTICSFITENHPPNVNSWAKKFNRLQTVVSDLKPTAELTCPGNKKVSAVEFASYGDPIGFCGIYDHGNCTAPNAKQVVEQYCLGKPMCRIPVERGIFDLKNDACPNIVKTLAVQVKCTGRGDNNKD